MGMRWTALLVSGVTMAGLAAGHADGRVTRLVIEARQSPAFDGKMFGHAGQYEILNGHVYGELDPADPANAIITDLALAPRGADGKVEYSATFTLFKPIDMAKASGVLVYEVPNRGGLIFDGPDDSGHVYLASGWQGDIPPRPGLQTITVPTARDQDGSPVTGLALATFANMGAGLSTLPITGGLGQGVPRPEPVTLDTAMAHLTKRPPDGAPVEITAADWAFADCGTAAFPGVPDPHHICLKAGFDPAYLYELVYPARDPLVLGIGFAATRDINAFFRGGR